jgi:hypothetical protein
MRDAPIVEPPRFCSRCGSPVVVSDAVYCKQCGAPLASTVWLNRDMTWRPWIALVLSIVPGLGHWYKGQIFRGIIWFFTVSCSYLLQPLGLMMHIICAGNAALGGALKEDLAVRWSHRRRSPARSKTRPRPT